MIIYKTVVTTDDPTHKAFSWQASQTEASKARGLLKKMGYKPETVTVNFPTGKGAIIEWLNENVKS